MNEYCKYKNLDKLYYLLDRDKFYSSLYKNWNLIEKIDDIGYKYFYNCKVVRFDDIKSVLKFNEENEHEICYKNKYFRIYDCSKIKLEFVLKNDEL